MTVVNLKINLITVKYSVVQLILIDFAYHKSLFITKIIKKKFYKKK